MEQWLIAWPSAALAHGHSPLLSTYLNAPGGVNLMWNTSMPFLGVAAIPLVRLLGPIHAFMILLALGFAASATAMSILLRYWRASIPAAWLGGLVYGFSSLAFAEGSAGRLNLIWSPIPPVLVALLDRLLRDERPRPLIFGTVMGLLLTAQMVINEETLPMMALLTVLAAMFAVASKAGRQLLIERLGLLVRAGVAASLTFFVFGGYPLYVEFFGPYRLTGTVQSLQQLALFRADLASPVIPGLVQWFDPSWANRISAAFSNNPTEVTEYMGLPLILFLGAGSVALWRSWRVKVFNGILLLSFLLSLGPNIVVARHISSIPGPDWILNHIPLFDDIMPSRFAFGLWFAVAVLLALYVDGLTGWIRGRRNTPAHSLRLGRAIRTRGTLRRLRVDLRGSAASPMLAVICLLPMLPRWPYPELPATVPTFFRSASVETIPAGALVATYPYPVTSMAWPMDWQAFTGMQFRMLGGYVIGPDNEGAGTYFAYPNSLEYCLVNIFSKGTVLSNVCGPEEVRHTLNRLGVTVFIADESQPNVELASRVLSAAVGTGPRTSGGVLIWRCRPIVNSPAGCEWG